MTNRFRHVHALSAALIVSAFSIASSQGASDVLVKVPSAGDGAMALDAFQPDLPAVEGPFECTSHETLGSDLTSISAAFPNRAETKATVVVMIDPSGRIVRYAERRGPAVRPVIPRGTDPAAIGALVAAAADSARSTTITLDYRGARAIVANRGGGRPNQSASGPIAVVGSLDKLGKPVDRAARVLAQCGVK